MEQAQTILLEALKASFCGTVPTWPEDVDWSAVVAEAKAQTVMGLASPAVPVRDESTEQGKAHYLRMLYEQDRLLRLLDANGIPAVILKGSAAAVYYPKPHLRTMGDVDLLVPRGRFDEAAALMEANGYLYTHGRQEDEEFEGNAKHIGTVKNGIEFELHHHVSSNSPAVDELLEDAIAQREYRALNGYRFPVLPELENGISLLDHMASHLKSGMGLRQAIDWRMYCEKTLDDEFWRTAMGPAAEKLGFSNLAVTSARMCQLYLGLRDDLTWCADADEELAAELLDNLLSSGNFGAKAGEGIEVETVTTLLRSRGFFRYLHEAGERNWAAYHRHPWLKPFAGIYQICRYIRRGIRRAGKLGAGSDRGRRRAELLRKLNLE